MSLHWTSRERSPTCKVKFCIEALVVLAMFSRAAIQQLNQDYLCIVMISHVTSAVSLPSLPWLNQGLPNPLNYRLEQDHHSSPYRRLELTFVHTGHGLIQGRECSPFNISNQVYGCLSAQTSLQCQQSESHPTLKLRVERCILERIHARFMREKRCGA